MMLEAGAQYTTSAGTYTVKKLLGAGKSGHAYLVESNGESRVLKLMHSEDVDYYTFTENKVTHEVDAYERLRDYAVRVPDLYEYDAERGYLVKALVRGTLATEMIAAGTMTDTVIAQLFVMAAQVRPHGYNLDYFPSNYMVTNDGLLYHIDYELNIYMDEWNLANWGLWYWLNRDGMRRFLQDGNGDHINEPGTPIPIKSSLEAEHARLVAKFARG